MEYNLENKEGEGQPEGQEAQPMMSEEEMLQEIQRQEEAQAFDKETDNLQQELNNLENEGAHEGAVQGQSISGMVN